VLVRQHSFRLAASQAPADFAHAAAEPPAQQRSQSHAFGIADFDADLIDVGLAGPEKVHRALYPQVLEEGERRLAQHALHPARQGALAGAQRLRGLVEREAFSQASARPALEPLYQRISMYPAPPAPPIRSPPPATGCPAAVGRSAARTPMRLPGRSPGYAGPPRNCRRKSLNRIHRRPMRSRKSRAPCSQFHPDAQAIFKDSYLVDFPGLPEDRFTERSELQRKLVFFYPLRRYARNLVGKITREIIDKDLHGG
jgi:hypothetical protein